MKHTYLAYIISLLSSILTVQAQVKQLAIPSIDFGSVLHPAAPAEVGFWYEPHEVPATELAVRLNNTRGGGNCVVDESFSSGLPTNWALETTNQSGTWTYGQFGNSGGGYRILRDPNLQAQNESIVTDTFDLTGVNQPALFFDWYTSYFWSVSPNDNYDLLVEISVNGGANWDVIWTEEDEGEFNSYEWYSAIVDLSVYSGFAEVLIRIRYAGQQGAQANIDNIGVCEWQNVDLRMNQVYTSDNRSDYVYTKVPIGQATEFVIGGILTNRGKEDQDSLVYSWSILLEADTVAWGTENTLEQVASLDTHQFFFATGYTPNLEGNYVVQISAFSGGASNAEVNLDDNSLNSELEYTDFVWGHDYEDESYFLRGFTPDDEPEGYKMGCIYQCRQDGQEIHGVHFAVASSTTANPDLISTAESVYIEVYENTFSEGQAISETLYDFRPGDIDTNSFDFIQVGLDDPVEMNAGSSYIILISVLPGDALYLMCNTIDDGDGGQRLYGYGTSGNSLTYYNWIGLTTSVRINVNPDFTGIETELDETGFSIYPNPTSGITSVVFKDRENVKAISVIDIAGKMVAVQNAIGYVSSTTLNMSSFDSGIYFINVTTEKGVTTQKLIIQ